MFDNPSSLVSPTGATIAIRHQPARDRARAVLQVNHGLAEHSARYRRFAQTLPDAGFAVYAHDHRGHGRTIAPDAPQGVFTSGRDGVDQVIADVGAVHAHIAKQHPGVPLFIFGHSMGGLISMNYALRHPENLAGAAVWNANFSGGLAARAAQAILAWERMRLGSDVSSRLLPKLTFAAWARQMPNRRTDFDWLSHIEAEVDAYVADPLCGWNASVGMWQAIFRMIESGGQVERTSEAARALPFHLVGGGQDPATDMGKAVGQQADRMNRAGFSDVTLNVYPDARHETLNDHDAERATANLIGWMEARL